MNNTRIAFLGLALAATTGLVACGNVVSTGGGYLNGEGGNADETTTGDDGEGGNLYGEGGTGPIDSTSIATTTSGYPGTGGAGGAGGATSIAVAMTRAQMDVLWDEYWATHDESGSTGGSGGGAPLDPNDLFLEVSNVGRSCNSPTADLSCGGDWEMSIGVPPAQQHVGVYDLDDPAFAAYSFMSATGPLNSSDPEDCGWGGGSLGSGTLEILAIDASVVRFRVKLTGPFFDADPSGEYEARRCP